MGRVAFLVDGFNLYHSLEQTARTTAGKGTKWLDLGALCRANLFQIGGGSLAAGIYYFSAYAYHRGQQKVARHAAYVRCLEASGVQVEMSRFKKKEVKCFTCHASWARFEEKETDVAIAVKLLELFHLDSCDEAVIVTGDTDIAPAIRTARSLFPEKGIICAFPHFRANDDLRRLVHSYFTVSERQYRRHQFPDTVLFGDSGKKVTKPPSW